MVLSITAALITAGVLGLWWASTRGVSIAAFAALVFMFPLLVIVVLVGSIAAFIHFHIRKR